MGEINWDLTRVDKCNHKEGEPSMFVESDEFIFSTHTGKNVIQYWTGRNDEISINGWACAHSKNDVEEVKKYLLEKELDLKL